MDDNRTNGLYFGMDIGERSTLLSYYRKGLDEPVTVSTIMGSQVYQIPTYIAKKRGVGQWFFGNDAIRQTQLSMAVGVEHLYSKAKNDEYLLIDTEEYSAVDLLMIYIRKLITIPSGGSSIPIAKLIITVDSLDDKAIDLFTMIASRLSLSADQLLLLDYRESFYYYALSQDRNLYLHDVMLFDYSQSDLKHTLLKRNSQTKPQVVNLFHENHGTMTFDKDQTFEKIIKEVFANEVISSVYLIGDGFDGDWMEESLKRLCQGRRVFMGKNLYSKGACYAGLVKDAVLDWDFIYIGDNDLKLNLSLKIIDHNEMKFFTLLTAGESWFDAKGECEVILDGSPSIELWLQSPHSRKAITRDMDLDGMPQRENRTTRLRINAVPKSDTQVVVMVTDLGFGELEASSGKVWEKVVEI